MTSPRTIWNRAVAVTAASAVAVAVAVPPSTADAVSTRPSVTERTFDLSASTSLAPLPIAFPTSIEQIAAAIIPSFDAPVPSPPVVGPVVAPTNINSAIKNVYNAVEPWVRYGFELATYAAGWVPYVGWLSGQIMIFYNFGERIVRSITFNVDDWLFGPLPFVTGLRNVAQDTWDALVQLGIDQWNFWLPPLPPLPPPLPLAADESADPDEPSALRTLATDGETNVDAEAEPVAEPSVDDDAGAQEQPSAVPLLDEELPPAQTGDDEIPATSTDEGTEEVIDDATEDDVDVDVDVDPTADVDGSSEEGPDPDPTEQGSVDPSDDAQATGSGERAQQEPQQETNSGDTAPDPET